MADTSRTTRRQSKREAPEVKAERARVLLDDPQVREVFKAVRQELVSNVERVVLDGTPEKERAALEAVRQLQSLNEVQRMILRPLVAAEMKKRGVHFQ